MIEINWTSIEHATDLVATGTVKRVDGQGWSVYLAGTIIRIDIHSWTTPAAAPELPGPSEVHE